MPDFFYEKNSFDLFADNSIVAGVDEAGRGPLAGPVVAGAVIFPNFEITDYLKENLDDSKKLKPKIREEIYEKLIESNAIIGCGQASVEEIDKLNILQATFLAMKRAVSQLSTKPTYILIDGNLVPPGLPCAGKSLVKGDAKSLSISAASIIAKVSRDRLMKGLSIDFPNYGWDKNAGYGTKDHLKAIDEFGITIHHRRSFAPIKQIVEKSLSDAK